MPQRRSRSGFTLIELLVVIGIIAILVAISVPIYRTAMLHADMAGCISHMRTLGGAFDLYASDNNGLLPGRVLDSDGSSDKWPILLESYVGNNLKVYVDPADPIANAVSSANMLQNSQNNSSFIYNGFNDLGAHSNPNITVGLAQLAQATGPVAILGEQDSGSPQFYLDVNDGDQNSVLNKTSYFGGSNYTFSDGSVQFIPLSQYSDSIWLVNKNYAIPGG